LARGIIARNEKRKIRVWLFGRAKLNAHAIGMNTSNTFNQELVAIAHTLLTRFGAGPSVLSGTNILLVRCRRLKGGLWESVGDSVDVPVLFLLERICGGTVAVSCALDEVPACSAWSSLWWRTIGVSVCADSLESAIVVSGDSNTDKTLKDCNGLVGGKERVS
jgi:hypothetical protein